MKTDFSVPAWVEPQLECRRQMREWIGEAIEREDKLPWNGRTDESTFMMSWFPFYALTGDEAIPDFARRMREKWSAWAVTHLHHGYFPRRAEEHHHTEDYKRFLGRLWYFDDHEEQNVSALEDFAHHLGNWIKDVPAWYDWKKHRFVNRFLGTVEVSTDPATDFNTVGFFRYLIVLLQAYFLTGKERYLALCLDYASRWADFLEAADENEPLPTGAGPDWEVRENDPAAKIYLFSGGCCPVLLDLYLLTGNDRFRRLARRILRDALSFPETYSVPFAWEKAGEINSVVTANLANYRAVTGDASFDRIALDAAGKIPPSPLPDRLEVSGKAPDFSFRWWHDHGDGEQEIAGRPPAVEALLFQITGDAAYLARALALAARKLELVRPVGNEGREHGCSSGNINGVVLNDVMPTLFPACLGLYGACPRGISHYRPLVLFRKPDGTPGLPERVAAVLAPGKNRVVLHNAAEEPADLEIVDTGGAVTVARGGPWKTGGRKTRIRLRPRATAEVDTGGKSRPVLLE